MQSCNVAMMRIGAMMGKDIFTKYQAIFGMGQKTGGHSVHCALLFSVFSFGLLCMMRKAFRFSTNELAAGATLLLGEWPS